MATTKSPEIKNVAIVGTGVIGASWAALYLARGLNVVATDPGPNAEANLRRYIDAAWKDLTALGISPNGSRDHLRFTLDMKEAVAGADLVQENGPERKDFKIKLFADMDAAAPKDSIIASSSSGLTMSVMQSACKYPERCVIGHPFNPPHMVPLVEVVAGEKTSPETVERAISFYTSIGKRADPRAKGSGWPCCEPAPSRALSGNRVPHWTRCFGCRGFRCRGVLGTWITLGSNGTQSAVPSRWRPRRDSTFHGTVHGADGGMVERSRYDH